ncbi:MAG: AAA family ATPase, partial [Deltaproteobacteria bacterium]|nr:AAA family ATPase [Deltaproteobacteria bacterium]
MAKTKTIYACQSCGYQAPKWLGKCPDCNQWSSFAEERLEKATSVRGELSLGTKEDPAPIHEINTAEEGRVQCGIGEFDRVLGGGLVPGSVILIGGDPGIGKSTLLLQAFAAISEKGLTCLYVSGEESPRQIKMRAERLGIAAPNLLILSETSLERI